VEVDVGEVNFSWQPDVESCSFGVQLSLAVSRNHFPQQNFDTPPN